MRNISHKTFENWGSEFFDDGNYGKKIVTRQISELNYLPLKLVEKMLDRKYIAEIILDQKYINELVASIKIYGIKNPGKITFDDQRVRLSDGNHRFLAAQQLGLRDFPVEISRVDRIKRPSIMLSELLPELLELLWLEKM